MPTLSARDLLIKILPLRKTSVVAGRLVLGVAPKLVNRRDCRCTENVSESLLTSGALNSSGNRCGSQQVYLPSQQGNVSKRKDDLRLLSSAWRGTMISHCLRHTACLTARVDDFCDHGHTMNHIIVVRNSGRSWREPVLNLPSSKTAAATARQKMTPQRPEQ